MTNGGSGPVRSPSEPRRAYDEKAIRTLDPLEHIRLRTGMYIGRIGDGSHPQDGVYVMLKEIVDNAVDEFIMGAGRRIDIDLDFESGRVRVRDYGRGIPLGKVVDCVSRMNTGGKYNDDVFQFSVGLNGVGAKAVNALSREFVVESVRGGRFVRARFERGRLLERKEGRRRGEPDGTLVEFVPDEEIFGNYSFQERFIAKRLAYTAYLHSGLKIVFNGKTFVSRGGLKDLLASELGDRPTLYEIAHVRAERLEFAFTHVGDYGENHFSFVNGQYTNDGGTHLKAFREGLVRGVNDYAGKTFAAEDVREGLVGAVSVRIQEPVFESQTKNKLGNTDVRPWIVQQVREQTAIWLHRHEEAAAALLEKIRSNEKVRRELQAVKKEARERARKVAIRIPKLTDCRIHLGDRDPRAERSTLFLVEGDSAGGTMIQCRDVHTQAVFSLRGKPLNCYGLGREALYKNEELYNVMRALGIEHGLEGLRYARVVIATDADVDGMHIRNLLLTYFLRFFEELVTSGHLFILETPLWRVRNKRETVYCYSEEERRAAEERLDGAETTRFKGLGEINPREFARFIGDDMRLSPVVVENIGAAAKALSFFMGRNTPERRDFVVANLAQDVL